MSRYARRIDYMEDSAKVVRSFYGTVIDPELISLGVGAPAPEALPIDTLREIANDVLRRDGRGIEALQYGPNTGVKDLQEVIVEQLLAPNGIKADPKHIMVTVGGMEALTMACELFIDAGDVILVERPTFVQAVETFQMFEAKCIGVEMDEDGLILEDLIDKIKRYKPKMLYTIPSFQNPSGRTLTLERRMRLAEIAAMYDIMILEDDPYREIRYSGKDLPPIKAFDTTGHVLFANSFSKCFSAGSRLGYMIANDDQMMLYLQGIKTAMNSHTTLLPQILCAEFFKRGYYPAHRKMICDLYRERRDVMMECIEAYFPKGTKFTRPDGGLFTWVQLPGNLNTTLLHDEALARPDIKVKYVAGEKFFPDGGEPVKNCMRISFGAIPPEKIRLGTQRLCKLLNEKLQ